MAILWMRSSCKVRILYILKETRINMVFQTSKMEEFSRILWFVEVSKVLAIKKFQKALFLGLCGVRTL